MIETTQYVLDFPVLKSLNREDFVIGACNRLAADFIRTWPEWPSHALIISGEAASGKSHLAHIWAEKAGAQTIPAAKLNTEMVPDLKANVVLEGADAVRDANALLHLFNWTRDKKGFLLMTAVSSPSHWGFDLKDLSSRLKSVPVAPLSHPDEAILAAAMAKQFSDRQILVDDAVISYLLKRMERSFSAVQTVVEKVDTLSLRKKSRVTIPLARKVLEGR